MRRKSVRQILESIGRLRATVRSERVRIGRRLAERLAAPTRAAQAYSLVLAHLEAELAAIETDLAAAEDAYGNLKHRPAELRRRRDRAALKLYERLAPLRRLLSGLPELRSTGIVGSTPSAPRPLVEQTAQTVAFLRQLERDPPPPMHGVIIDPGAAAEDLEAAGGRLGALLEELKGAEAQATAARAEAERALAHAKSVAPFVMQALEGLAGLAHVAASAGGSGVAVGRQDHCA